jgi:hypothetical protein
MAAGTVAAMYASLLATSAPAIPYKLIPDVRPLLLFVATWAVGAYAAWGPGRRRGFLIAFLLSVHGVFALDVSTIHWIAPVPGPLGGMRADPVRLVAGLTGLASAVLLQARIHPETWRADAERRGVAADDARAVEVDLRRIGSRAILLASGIALGAGLLVDAASALLGDEGSMPPLAALLVGGALAAVVVVVAALGPSPGRRSSTPDAGIRAP